MNREGTQTPPATATPAPMKTTGSERQTPSPVNQVARETKRRGSQAAQLLALKRHTKTVEAQTVAQQSANSAKHTPSHVKRDPPAPVVATNAENAEEIVSGGATGEAAEVSRIEIQTSDPNIRIIWLSPRPDADAVAQPLK